jgi:hypothetical protein
MDDLTPPNTLSNKWTREDDDELMRLLTIENLPFKVVFKMFPGRSRNAVIGRAHRLKLKMKRESPALVPLEPEPKVVIARKWPHAPRKTAPALPPEPPVFRTEHNCDLLELESNQCRWPVREKFCGAPTAVGHRQPYCEFHQELNYRDDQPRKRKRDWTWTRN